jgi:hypothetical protein
LELPFGEYEGEETLRVLSGYWSGYANSITGELYFNYLMNIDSCQLTPELEELGGNAVETGPWSVMSDPCGELNATIDLNTGKFDLGVYDTIADMPNVRCDSSPDGKFYDDMEGEGSFILIEPKQTSKEIDNNKNSVSNFPLLQRFLSRFQGFFPILRYFLRI